MSRTLYVSDLDGTLLAPDSRVSAASERLLRQAIAHGAEFTVATARTPATVSNLLSGVSLTAPAIVMTGATLWNQQTGAYSDAHFISPAAVERVRSAYRRVGLPAFTYTLGTDGLIHIYHAPGLDAAEAKFISERAGSPFKNFHITNELPTEAARRVLLFYAMQPTAITRRAFDALQDNEEVNPIFYHDIFGPDIAILEVFSAEVSKAAAARRVAALRGCNRIVAFGDNINDLPLLRAADVAVAVGNAVEDVRRAAHVVIDSNADDSVARFIARECGIC